MKKIGILAGTFDPVHIGHVNFALSAIEACGLERVFLLPERRPRVKKNAAAFSHRLAMLQLTTKDNELLDILELPEDQFTISGTLPRLRQRFAPRELVFLMGSDVVAGLGSWPGLGQMIIGLREGDSRPDLEKLLDSLKISPRPIIIASPSPAVASTSVRGEGGSDSTDPAVLDYINQHKLYT